MKELSILLIFCTFLPLFTFSQNSVAKSTTIQDLQGEWVIDLRPTPESEPYLKNMNVVFYDGKRFTGTFYDSPFDNGVTNSIWGRTYFAFSTKGGSSIYFTSGYIENNAIKGLTYCENREFVMPWAGKRKKEITK